MNIGLIPLIKQSKQSNIDYLLSVILINTDKNMVYDIYEFDLGENPIVGYLSAGVTDKNAQTILNVAQRGLGVQILMCLSSVLYTMNVDCIIPSPYQEDEARLMWERLIHNYPNCGTYPHIGIITMDFPIENLLNKGIKWLNDNKSELFEIYTLGKTLFEKGRDSKGVSYNHTVYGYHDLRIPEI